MKAGPALYDSYHDFALADAAMFEAGLSAEDDGFQRHSVQAAIRYSLW